MSKRLARANDPAKWSSKALSNYQRARSSPVTITNAAGESRTVSAWYLEKQRQRNRRRARAKS